MVLIHFPIALFTIGVAFDFVAQWKRKATLAVAAYYNLLVAAGWLAWWVHYKARRLPDSRLPLYRLTVELVGVLFVALTGHLGGVPKRRFSSMTPIERDSLDVRVYRDQSVSNTSGLLVSLHTESRRSATRIDVEHRTWARVILTQGVSGAAVSAGKAEPTDENAADNLKTNLLFSPVTRTSGKAQKGDRQCPKASRILHQLVVCHSTQI